MSEARFVEQDRKPRRNHTGLAAGSFLGAVLALVLALLTDYRGGTSLALAVGLGAAVGGIIGWLAVRRISADEWEPTDSAKPFVGAHTPDDDTSDQPAPPAGKLRPAR